jgi:hypothetical protein
MAAYKGGASSLSSAVGIDPFLPRHAVIGPTGFQHRMFQPEAAYRLANQKPNKTAMLAIARHIEQFAGSPSEFDSKASPAIEEASSVIESLPPSRVRNPHWPLALQPCPGVKVDFRHAA